MGRQFSFKKLTSARSHCFWGSGACSRREVTHPTLGNSEVQRLRVPAERLIKVLTWKMKIMPSKHLLFCGVLHLFLTNFLRLAYFDGWDYLQLSPFFCWWNNFIHYCWKCYNVYQQHIFFIHSLYQNSSVLTVAIVDNDVPVICWLGSFVYISRSRTTRSYDTSVSSILKNLYLGLHSDWTYL